MVHIINRLAIVLAFLLAATGAHAQTNPLGAGYSFANGQLFVQTSASLNSLTLPFSMSFNVIAPTLTSSVVNTFISANPSNSGVGGFNVAFSNSGNDSYKLNARVFPASAGTNQCNANGQMCWRFPFIEDGNLHNVCVRWTQSGGFMYLDSIIRDQSPKSDTYATTTDLFWLLGNNAPSTWKMFDVRVYAGDIGAAGCVNLANDTKQGVYPTTGPLSTGMVLHLNMDSTAAPCALSGGTWICPDTSGFVNSATSGSLLPAIAIATPVPGTVSGTTSITVSCTLAVGTCEKVCYYMDGFLLSSSCPSTASPTYAFSWDTTKTIDGSHVLTAVGYAVSGLTTTSAPVTVTTSNGISAVTYQFDGVNGSDSNNCISAPCKSSSKFNSLTLKGGDTVQFNSATSFTSDPGVPPIVCGPASGANCPNNFFPSSSPLTITKYGAGTCNPLTGSATVIPTGCARIIGNASGTAIQLYNASNVIVENLAFTGNMGAKGIAIDTTRNSLLGASSGVTIQNNYVNNFSYGISTNKDLGFTFTNQQDNGHVINCLIQDNYVTAPFGATSSPDAGITTFGGSTCMVQGNLQENAGNSGNDSQGNGLATQNWPNPGGTTTLNTFQFNVTRQNGGNHNNGSGGPYSLYSIGGDSTVFQFNEEYNQICWFGGGYPACLSTYSGIDNGAADDDLGSTHILHQYNYMHNNPMPGSNGMLLLSGNRSVCCGGNPGWGDNWFRYNVLENNYLGIQGLTGNGGITFNDLGWYNNTLSSNLSNPVNNTQATNVAGTCLGPAFGAYNNLCINAATSGFQNFVGQFAPFCSGMDYNDFYSVTGSAQNRWLIPNNSIQTTLAGWISACSAGSHNMNVNPLLAGTPGTGGTCWPGGTTPPAGPTQPPSAANCPAVYQLTTSSPLIGVGKVITSTPTPDVTVDYYGNAVPNGVGTGYNIGADGGHH